MNVLNHSLQALCWSWSVLNLLYMLNSIKVFSFLNERVHSRVYSAFHREAHIHFSAEMFPGFSWASSSVIVQLLMLFFGFKVCVNDPCQESERSLHGLRAASGVAVLAFIEGGGRTFRQDGSELMCWPGISNRLLLASLP